MLLISIERNWVCFLDKVNLSINAEKGRSSKSEGVGEFDTRFQGLFLLQTFEGVQKCKKTETLTAIMERIVKAEVGHHHGDEPNS